ncbi:hypothetical protein, partial [Paenibacillus hemerocallicola]|uniref:hypothetical protein n=1 Tax=Paenibacillus hemerocallicola TaxID=1172614 RepID=UPI001C4029CC
MEVARCWQYEIAERLLIALKPTLFRENSMLGSRIVPISALSWCDWAVESGGVENIALKPTLFRENGMLGSRIVPISALSWCDWAVESGGV